MTDTQTLLNDALDGRRLLSHPFYKRWTDGELEMSELTAYAEQYRHFEANLPAFLRASLEQMPAGEARRYVEDNLADETASPSHVELFDHYVTAVEGKSDVAPTPATTALLDTYSAALAEGPGAALGALAAYEVQSADVADTKCLGLREHYGLDADQTRFWEVHSSVDVTHAAWVVAAIDDQDDKDAVRTAAERTAQAWWNFLDEREAARPVAAV